MSLGGSETADNVVINGTNDFATQGLENNDNVDLSKTKSPDFVRMDRGRLCVELDEVVLAFFEKLSELDGKKAALEQVMAEGFIQLSKTRYNMGATGSLPFGASMYDRSSMVATTGVVLGDANSMRLLGPSSPLPSKSLDPPAKDLKQNINNEQTEQLNGDGGLRRRKVQSEKEVEEEAEGKSRVSENPPSSVEKRDEDEVVENLGKAVGDLRVSADGMMELQDMVKDDLGGSPSKGYKKPASPGRDAIKTHDPIRWFGILTPQSLKISQQKFRTSLEIVVDIANLQLELGILQKRFKELSKRKRDADAREEEEKTDS